MANKATSQKLAERTYPALQEFLGKLTGIVVEKHIQPLLDDTTQTIISDGLRHALLEKQAHSMAYILNELYSELNSA